MYPIAIMKTIRVFKMTPTPEPRKKRNDRKMLIFLKFRREIMRKNKGDQQIKEEIIINPWNIVTMIMRSRTRNI